jgi:amidase
LSLPRLAKTSLREFKIAVILTTETAEVDPSVQDRIQGLADFLARAKAKVSDRARPDIDPAEAHHVYIQLLRAATSRNLTDDIFARNLEAARSIPSEDSSYYAWMTKANTIYHRDWLQLNETRQRMRLKWAEFFEEYDLLLCPVAATAAFPHDQQGERWERMIPVNGKPQPSTTQMFWAGYSGMVSLPSTVAPAGFTAAGLPVGVQIVGPQYADLTCIRFAQLLEREYQGFVAPPGYE